jgi:diamine N-acetyltransferase
MNIHFRSAKQNDIDMLLEMMAAFNAIDGYHFDENITRNNLLRFISNEQLGRLWMIAADEGIIGYVALSFGFSFEFKGPTAFIDELYLQDAYRGKGVGGLAIDFIDQQAQQSGIKALHLEVERHNEKGKRLYVRKGFVEHERALMTKRFK